MLGVQSWCRPSCHPYSRHHPAALLLAFYWEPGCVGPVDVELREVKPGRAVCGANRSCSLLPKPKNEVKPLEAKARTDAGAGDAEAGTRLAAQPTESRLIQNNTLEREYDEQGDVKYDALARVGHSSSRVVQAGLADMQPAARQVWSKPPAEEIARQLEVTRAALEKILNGKIKATQPKGAGSARGAPLAGQFVRFSAADGSQAKVVRMVEAQQDPFAPPKFHHKRIPRPPPSPPAPVLHSPPRKVTAEEQAAWKIPPCISNWKNQRGYTIPLDKRLAADGRGLIENTINPGFAGFSESLYLAEQHARKEVETRAAVTQKLAEHQKLETEEHLRQLAEDARRQKLDIEAQLRREAAAEDPVERPIQGSGLSLREREEIRRERAREQERDVRLSRMGADMRAKLLAREADRDVSERIALGSAAAPAGAVAGRESMYDQRLFDQTSGIASGFGDEDAYNLYSRPLFGAGAAGAHLIYKPAFAPGNAMDEEDDAIDSAAGRGRAAKAFSGAAEGAPRTGPVEFEMAPAVSADPFGLDQLLQDARTTAMKRPAEPPGDQPESSRARRR